MTRKETLKIIEEVMASIDSHAGMVAPDDAKLDDWVYDLNQVFEAILDGDYMNWEEEDEC